MSTHVNPFHQSTGILCLMRRESLFITQGFKQYFTHGYDMFVTDVITGEVVHYVIKCYLTN